MSARTTATVVTSGSPELQWLAVELAARGDLGSYIHPLLLRRSGWWSRGSLSHVVPERRLIPPELGTANVISGAAAQEWLRVGILRGRWVWAEDRLMSARTQALAAKAAEAVIRGDRLVVSHGCAGRALEVSRRSMPIFLNMQSCHPALRRRLLERELARVSDVSPSPLRRYTSESIARFHRELREVDRVMVGSRFAKESLVHEGIEDRKIAVIPYGVDTDFFHPPVADGGRRRSDRFTVVFIGTLTPGKGVQDLIKAYGAFEKSDTKLILAGAAPHGTAWLGLRGQVEHRGHLSHEGTARLLREADVMVLPTLFEGLGLAALESLASGVPVITTRRGADEVVEDGASGFLVPVSSPEGILEKLEFLYADDDALAGMRHAARRQAKRYSWGVYQKRAAEFVLGVTGSC